MKKIFSMVMVGVMAVAMVGCGGSSSSSSSNAPATTPETAAETPAATPEAAPEVAGDITLGLSVDQQFESRVGVTDAIKAEAAARGFSVDEVIADGDAQTQNSQIETLINKQVDALLVCAVDQNTIETALLKAKQAGIPVVAFDRDLPDSVALDAFIGPDSLSDGRECGKAMAEALAGMDAPIKVLDLIGALNDQNGIDRSAGWTEEILKLEGVEIIQMPTDWDSQKALSATQNAFQANPDIKGVYCGTDSFIPGVETVLTDLGLNALVGEEGHIFVNGVNGSNDGYVATIEGVADGFLVMDLEGTGIKSVEIADALIKGESVDKVNLVPGIYYTHENTEANKDKIWGAK